MQAMSQAHKPVLVYERIEANRRNTLLFLALFVLLLLPVAAFLIQYLAVWVAMFLFPALMMGQPEPGAWLWRVGLALLVSGIILLALVILRYRHATESALRFLGARPLARQEAQELWHTVENLCIGAGLPMPRLYVLEESTPNAFAVGLSPERASLAVTRGLLQLLDRRELEGVIAHELSHIGNDDIRLDTTVASLLRTIRLPKPIAIMALVQLVIFLPMLPWLLFSGEQGKIEWIWIFPFLTLAYVLSWPLLGRFIQRAISRQREFMADAEAMLLTRNPEGLARALAKIAAAPHPGIRKSGAMAHLFIVEPQKPGWLRLGLSTHPPLSERIEHLARMGTGIPPSVLEEARQEVAGFSYAPADTETLLPVGEKVVSFLDAAIQGIAWGVTIYVGFFILNVLTLAGKGSIDQLVTFFQWLGGVGAFIAFGVAAYRRGLRGRRLLPALVFMYFISGWLPVMLKPITNLGNTWAISLEFIWSVALIFLAGATGSYIGSKEFRSTFNETVRTLMERSGK